MKNISTRNFRILCDFMDIRQFMVEIYERNWKNGVPAPFFEYALSSDWMDKSYTHRYRIWEDNGKIVAFCFTENPVNHIYFSIRSGYEFLAEEMVEYSEKYMPRIDEKHTYVLFDGQEAAQDAVSNAGYVKTWGYNEMIYDFSHPLNYPLSQGFEFEKCGNLNIKKVAAALSEMYRRMKPLVATHMTGGDDSFYAAIGFQRCIEWTYWEKK